MRIPEVRNSLAVLSIKLANAKMPEEAKECLFLMEQLKRRPPTRVAKPKSRPFTPEVAAEIVAIHEANPDMTYPEIAAKVKVNPGRVTDAIKGKRT